MRTNVIHRPNGLTVPFSGLNSFDFFFTNSFRPYFSGPCGWMTLSRYRSNRITE